MRKRFLQLVACWLVLGTALVTSSVVYTPLPMNSDQPTTRSQPAKTAASKKEPAKQAKRTAKKDPVKALLRGLIL